jgi:general L-amino acid transport system substrate-binding protein
MVKTAQNRTPFQRSKETKMRALISTALTFLALSTASFAGTLDDVKARGKLNCGVNTGLLGFSEKGADGKWAGFDVDYCKALAAATLGDAEKVEFVPLTAQDRFEKLKTGVVDVLARNTTWTMERETKMPFRFVGVTYHDGQGFMMKSLMGVTSVFNMSQASICVVNGTTAAANIDDFFKERDMTYTVLGFDTAAEAIKNYEAGKCDAFSTDQSALYAQRLKLAKPDETVILPEVISKEPLGPSVRADDAQWFNINRWVTFALINAEELEVRQPIIDDLAKNSKKPAVRRLLGAEGTLGADLGLDKDWAARAIKAVGNYGEMFDRNLGEASALKIQRGLNATWDKGGVLYAPPVR